jgi:hypothetical protein
MSLTNRGRRTDGECWPEAADRADGCWPAASDQPSGDCWPEPAGGQPTARSRRAAGRPEPGDSGPGGLDGLGGLLGRAVAGWATGSGGRRIRSGS